jgi:hypothetical protein
VPEAIPPATPGIVDALIVPTAVLLLVHVPPTGPEFRLVVEFTHTVSEPVIFEGSGLTVTTTLAVQPVLVLVKITVAVPAVTPVTAPVNELTVTLGLGELQEPGPPVLLNIVVPLTQTENVPVDAGGNAFTVTTADLLQPVTLEVKTVVKVPTATPPASPVAELIVPVVIGLLLHVPPPAVAFARAVVELRHTASEPVILLGKGFTVTIAVT